MCVCVCVCLCVCVFITIKATAYSGIVGIHSRIMPDIQMIFIFDICDESISRNVSVAKVDRQYSNNKVVYLSSI